MSECTIYVYPIFHDATRQAHEVSNQGWAGLGRSRRGSGGCEAIEHIFVCVDTSPSWSLRVERYRNNMLFPLPSNNTTSEFSSTYSTYPDKKKKKKAGGYPDRSVVYRVMISHNTTCTYTCHIRP